MTVYTDGMHLIADSLQELHVFAAYLGLRREWFQGHSRHLHYDLTSPKKLTRALRLGAVRVTTRECATISRRVQTNE